MFIMNTFHECSSNYWTVVPRRKKFFLPRRADLKLSKFDNTFVQSNIVFPRKIKFFQNHRFRILQKHCKTINIISEELKFSHKYFRPDQQWTKRRTEFYEQLTCSGASGEITVYMLTLQPRVGCLSSCFSSLPVIFDWKRWTPALL